MRGLPLLIAGLLVVNGARAQTAPAAQPQQPYPQQPYPQQPYPQQPYPQQPSAPPPVYEPSFGPYQRKPVADEGDQKERPAWELAAPPSRHRHDGLYLRLAGGIGTGFDSMEGQGPIGDGDLSASGATGSASGFAGATEIAFGASPIPGFVLGGGVYTATLTGPEGDDVSVATGDPSAVAQRYKFTLTQLAMFAAMTDVYPWPSEGLHAQAGVGFATIVMGLGEPSAAGTSPSLESHTATGFGFMVGAGYEWWVGDEWSLGGLARLLYAWTSGTDRESVSWSHQGGAFSLMLTVTHH